jgi:predicted nucleotidyltransferase
MAEKMLVDINRSLHELCAEREIPVELVRFFGSHSQGAAPTDSDVDVMIVSPAFEGKDIFQRVKMMKGMHRALVRRFNVPFDVVFCSVSEWLYSKSPLLQIIRQGA